MFTFVFPLGNNSTSHGTVTSVGLTMPSDYIINNSPIVDGGDIAVTYANQLANKVFASPNGAIGVPSFRSLVGTDLPGATTSLIGALSIATNAEALAGLVDKYIVPSNLQYVLSNYTIGAITPSNTTITGTDTFNQAFAKAQGQINAKQNTLTFGDVTGSEFSITGGTGAVIGSGLVLALATTGVTAATYGTATSVPVFTVDSKGRITGVTNTPISFPPSGVTSVFGRTGAVTAQAGDYTFAQIGSTPTTLAGYGITDAVATSSAADLNSLLINGSSGAGFLSMLYQSARPAGYLNHTTVSAGATGNIVINKNQQGFDSTIALSATAARTYTLPDVSGTIYTDGNSEVAYETWSNPAVDYSTVNTTAKWLFVIQTGTLTATRTLTLSNVSGAGQNVVIVAGSSVTSTNKITVACGNKINVTNNTIDIVLGNSQTWLTSINTTSWTTNQATQQFVETSTTLTASKIVNIPQLGIPSSAPTSWVTGSQVGDFKRYGTSIFEYADMNSDTTTYTVFHPYTPKTGWQLYRPSVLKYPMPIGLTISSGNKPKSYVSIISGDNGEVWWDASYFLKLTSGYRCIFYIDASGVPSITKVIQSPASGAIATISSGQIAISANCLADICQIGLGDVTTYTYEGKLSYSSDGQTQQWVGTGGLKLDGGLQVKSSGANDRQGVATLVAGTITVSNTSIKSTDNVMITVNGVGVLANLGYVYEDKANRVANTSFTIKSNNALDTSTVAWVLIGTY